MATLWGPRPGKSGPWHLAQDAPHEDLSWCGARIQFRHQRQVTTIAAVTCQRCLRRMGLGRPLARGARS